MLAVIQKACGRKKDQMGEEDQCVFSGAVCFIQNQICGKPAQPTLCLMAESGFRLEPWSWEELIHLPHPTAVRGGLPAESQASPVSFTCWKHTHQTCRSGFCEISFAWSFQFEFCESYTFYVPGGSNGRFLAWSSQTAEDKRSVRNRSPQCASFL